jgi:hypothetical protein
MKSKILKLTLLLAVVLLILSCVRTVYRTAPPPPPPPRPILDLDITLFYDELSPYGEWIYIDAYGWIWAPRVVPMGWKPYTHGKWIYTDHGLMWISKYKWGWAPFHYGRWLYDPYYGWIWIPGKTWGPAWVAWSHGIGYIGWAPLPPQVRWSVGIGLDFGDIDINVVIQPHFWCFITEHRLLHPSIHGYIIPPARNVTVVKKIKHVTKYVVVEKKIVNKSFTVEGIRKAVGRPFTPIKVVDIDSAAIHGKSAKGKGVQMYRPALKDPPRGKTPKKVSPPPKPKPPIMKRHENEKAHMERQHKKEMKELERIHRKQERNVMKSEEPLIDIRKQQKEERKAFKEQMKREKEVLKKKHEREKKKASAKKEGAEKEESKEKEKKGSKGRKH